METEYLWRDFYEDPNLGSYSLSSPVISLMTSDSSLTFKICVFILEARKLGERRSIGISHMQRHGLEEADHWEVELNDVLHAWPREPVAMIDRALVNLSRLANWPSDEIQITKECEYLLYSQNTDQAEWMVRQLQSSGYVSFNPGGGHDCLGALNIESAGWVQISELLRKSRPTNPEAFVAMAFNDDMRPFFDAGFRPAIEADGKTKCVRIDGVQHNNKICDEIIAAIRRCRYVVADFTGNRGGVYYEAGFAHGLGIPVIWTVKDSADDLHFDTRQYNHIVYKTPEELKTALQNRIAATIA